MARMAALQAIIRDLRELFQTKNDAEIFGPAGQPGNALGIVRFARRIGTSYQQLIEWKHSILLVESHIAFHESNYQLSLAADAMLDGIEQYGPALMEQVEKAVNRPPGTRFHITATLTLEVSNESGFAKATERLRYAIARGKAPAPNPAAGYIYVLQNPSMGNLLKIGKTSRSGEHRIAELSAATGVPTPFILAYEVLVEDSSTAEAIIHQRLEGEGYRVAGNREFFNVDLKTAIETVHAAQRHVAGITPSLRSDSIATDSRPAISERGGERSPIRRAFSWLVYLGSMVVGLLQVVTHIGRRQPKRPRRTWPL
jgi:hypothetical protein